MNCRDAEPLLFAERDGVLTPSEHAALSAHIAACSACAAQRARITEASEFLKKTSADVSVPLPDAEWRRLRSRLHEEKNPRRKSVETLAWFGAPIAAAAALAFLFFAEPTENGAAIETAQAEFVELGDADASTVVFVDKESGWLVVWATEDERS